MAIDTFKILNEYAPPVFSNLLIKRENKYNFRYPNTMYIADTTSKYLHAGLEILSLHNANTPIQIYWKFYHHKLKIFR